MKVYILIAKRDQILYRGSFFGCINYQSIEPRRVAVMRAGESAGKVIAEILEEGKINTVSSITLVDARHFY